MTLITIWEAGVLLFIVVTGSTFGVTFGVIAHFDSRIRALSAELRQVRATESQSSARVEFLADILRQSGHYVPKTFGPSVNVEAQGDVTIGGDVGGEDVTRSSGQAKKG